MAGYSLASMLHISGALAMVVAGLLLGHAISSSSTPVKQKKDISLFWKVIDDILNSILFVLIGLEFISIDFQAGYLILGIISIFIVLFARIASIGILNVFMSKEKKANFGTLQILTWAGLRGGISIALVFSLPEGEIRTGLLMVTYIIVVFSIIVQGLSIGKFVKHIKSKA